LTRLPSALLIDLDGTIYTEAGAIPGAVETVTVLRERGIPFRFVSNTTGRSRARVADRMRGYGFTVSPDELVTSVVAAAVELRRMGARRVAPFLKQAAHDDLPGLELSGGVLGPSRGRPDAVLVGDLGNDWSHALLNEAFRYLLDGVPLVALEKDRFWLGPTGLELDTGPYVSALEYGAGVKATVCGKPSPNFYQTALESMGFKPGNGKPAMIGDDLWSDVDGAQRAGLEGWLVRTGKFRADVLEKSGVRPDQIIDSIADLR
jgi:HAD superfamily hydrolase (TIGR01458 family)